MYKILIVSVLATLGSACGFHLKGATSSNSTSSSSIQQVTVEMNSNDQTLYQPLIKQLKASGFQVQSVSTEQTTPVLKILDYQFRRQQLNGKLTEVLLHLNVTFRIEDASGKALTQERTVRSYRNYQYNIATVNTENQEESYLKQKMLDDIAQQISMQISHQRLPKLQ